MIAEVLYNVLLVCVGAAPNWRDEQDKQSWRDITEYGSSVVIDNLEKSRRNPNAVFMTWEALAQALYERKFGDGFNQVPLTQKVAWEMVGRALTSIMVDQHKIGPTVTVEQFLRNIEEAAIVKAQERLRGMNGKHAEIEMQPEPEKQSEAAPIAKDSVRDQLERKAKEYEARAARLRQLVNVVTEEDLEILRVIFNKENVNG